MQNQRYENSGNINSGKRDVKPTDMGSIPDPTRFIHQLKEDAAQDKRHVPLRIQQGVSTRSLKSRPLRQSTTRVPTTGTGGNSQNYPQLGYQFSLSANYSKVDNPISKLNNLKSQQAANQRINNNGAQ